MSTKKRDMSMVMAVGEIEGHTIEILKIPMSNPERFEWRALIGDDIVIHPKGFSLSIEEAVVASIAHFYGDEAVGDTRAPDEMDFEVLNTLLVWEGPNGPLASIEEVKCWHNILEEGTTKLDAVEERSKQDFEMIEDILASAHYGSAEAIQRLHMIAEIFQKQIDLARHVNGREINALETFLSYFSS